ncbi:hypothetical protein [Streptomyces tsukubensis]|uniref:hypothetical protein n=1 Tax=Streptomyces tsukubensis TaxID=83656 RepID=UPI00344BCCCF
MMCLTKTAAMVAVLVQCAAVSALTVPAARADATACGVEIADYAGLLNVDSPFRGKIETDSGSRGLNLTPQAPGSLSFKAEVTGVLGSEYVISPIDIHVGTAQRGKIQFTLPGGAGAGTEVRCNPSSSRVIQIDGEIVLENADRPYAFSVTR